MKASALAVLIAAALVAGRAGPAGAAPRAAHEVTASDAQAIELPPALGEALTAFWKSLRNQGVKRLATTAARTVRAGERIHVRTFTNEVARLYTTGDTYDRAIVSAMCIWINLDWNQFGPEERTPEEWADNLYGTASVAFPGDLLWKAFGRSWVAKYVRTTQIAYYSPASARAYWIACGKKR
jgi:hypothetical protein